MFAAIEAIDSEIDENFEEVFSMAKAVVDRDTCVGCESCVGGCPVSAISIDDGKARVDATLCVGCGVCSQLCRLDAFESTGKEA